MAFVCFYFSVKSDADQGKFRTNLADENSTVTHLETRAIMAVVDSI